MQNRPRQFIKYDRLEIVDSTTGRLRYHNATLLVSMFPYTRGTKFDYIEIDVLQQKFIILRKNEIRTYNLFSTLSDKCPTF
jgi:hypothetical protein